MWARGLSLPSRASLSPRSLLLVDQQAGRQDGDLGALEGRRKALPRLGAKPAASGQDCRRDVPRLRKDRASENGETTTLAQTEVKLYALPKIQRIPARQVRKKGSNCTISAFNQAMWNEIGGTMRSTR